MTTSRTMWRTPRFRDHWGSVLSNSARPAFCYSVEDGDTLSAEVEIARGLIQIARIRLKGVYCYELSEAAQLQQSEDENRLAFAAWGFTAAKVLNQQIIVTPSSSQTYGRVVGDITYRIDGERSLYDLGDELVAQGLAGREPLSRVPLIFIPQ